MKKEVPSRTAEAAAAWRAAESFRSEDVRVCYDPLAKHFLGPKYRLVCRFRLLTKIGLWYAELVAPGAAGEIVARTRYIDDYLGTCVHNGIEQLVILGAGYDSRAYRLGELLKNIKVFELDHPTTQRIKKAKIKSLFGFFPDNITYVSIDFGKEKLCHTLLENSYDDNLKSLFILEGITMYLTAEAVNEILSFITENSGSGSSIVFNYIFRSMVAGTCKLEGAKRWRRTHERIGEPPTFGIEEAAVHRFLSDRGFYRVKNVTSEALQKAYSQGGMRKEKYLLGSDSSTQLLGLGEKLTDAGPHHLFAKQVVS